MRFVFTFLGKDMEEESMKITQLHLINHPKNQDNTGLYSHHHELVVK